MGKLVNWDTIVIELCQEHGIPIEMHERDEVLHQKRLQALIRESKMPVIPKGFEPKPVCTSHKRVRPRKTAKVQSFYNLEMAKCREEWERLGLVSQKAQPRKIVGKHMTKKA